MDSDGNKRVNCSPKLLHYNTVLQYLLIMYSFLAIGNTLFHPSAHQGNYPGNPTAPCNPLPQTSTSRTHDPTLSLMQTKYDQCQSSRPRQPALLPHNTRNFGTSSPSSSQLLAEPTCSPPAQSTDSECARPMVPSKRKACPNDPARYGS